jgi:hypothetical protein
MLSFFPLKRQTGYGARGDIRGPKGVTYPPGLLPAREGGGVGLRTLGAEAVGAWLGPVIACVNSVVGRWPEAPLPSRGRGRRIGHRVARGTRERGRDSGLGGSDLSSRPPSREGRRGRRVAGVGRWSRQSRAETCHHLCEVCRRWFARSSPSLAGKGMEDRSPRRPSHARKGTTFRGPKGVTYPPGLLPAREGGGVGLRTLGAGPVSAGLGPVIANVSSVVGRWPEAPLPSRGRGWRIGHLDARVRPGNFSVSALRLLKQVVGGPGLDGVDGRHQRVSNIWEEFGVIRWQRVEDE